MSIGSAVRSARGAFVPGVVAIGLASLLSDLSQETATAILP